MAVHQVDPVVEQIRSIFYPRSVAIVGASTNPLKTGNLLVQHLIDYGFQGDVYPINPEAGEVLGLKAYKSVKDAPGPVDLVYIVVGRGLIEQAIRECTEKGVKGVIIHTAGFGELGEEGKKLERRLAQMARGAGTRLIGPNCVGILCPETGIPWTRRSELPRQAGPVGIISSTGGGAGAFVNLARQRGIEFSKVISIGNQCDLTFVDFLRYFQADDATRAIFLYLEATPNGREFVEVAREVSREKPIIAYKIGRTRFGRRASMSHTGSIASPLEIYQAAFRQSGIIPAGSVEEVIDYLVGITRIGFRKGFPSGNRAAVITGPGGPGIAAVDACDDCGLDLPDFSEATIEGLERAIPGTTKASPVDMQDTSVIAVMKEKDPYGLMTSVVEADENIDMTLIVAPGEWNPGDFQHILMGLDKSCLKPYAAAWPAGGKEVEDCKSNLDRMGIPHFVTPERTAKTFAAIAKYGAFRSRPPRMPTPRTVQDFDSIRPILEGALRDDRHILLERESKAVLSAVGLKVTREKLASTREEAIRVAQDIGFPVVLKISSPDITHKTESGGVRVNLKTAEEVGLAFVQIVEAARKYDPSARVEGVLVQEMLVGRTDIIVGAIRDRQFGPVAMFGLGGVFVEVLRDVSLGIAPISEDDAREMIQGIKGLPLLIGARGRAPVSLDSLTDILVKVSALMESTPEVEELDLNPVLAGEEDSIVADARMVLGSSSLREVDSALT